MKGFTASRIELAKTCPGSFGIPWRDDRSDDSDTGKENHAEFERRILVGDIPEALTATFPNVTQWFAETKLAYNLATGAARILGSGNDRDYAGLDALEMAGTCDVYGIDGDRIIVVDWKLKYFTKAADNLQLRWYAIALARALGKDCATVAIFPEIGKPSTCELEPWDFDAFEVELRDLSLVVNRAAQVGEPLNVGPQCRHCPAFLSCPKQKQELALAVSGATDTQIEMMLPLHSDEQAAYAFDILQRLELMAKRLRPAVYARAGERAFQLSNGMMLGKVTKPGRESLDGDVVYDVVKAKHGQGIADAAVVRSATKKRLAEALALAGGKGQVASMERAVLDEVRVKGGAKRESKESIEQYQPQQALKAANT